MAKISITKRWRLDAEKEHPIFITTKEGKKKTLKPEELDKEEK